MRLSRLMSQKRTATRPVRDLGALRAAPARVSRTARFGRPVRGSCAARWRISSIKCVLSSATPARPESPQSRSVTPSPSAAGAVLCAQWARTMPTSRSSTFTGTPAIAVTSKAPSTSAAHGELDRSTSIGAPTAAISRSSGLSAVLVV